MSYPVFQVYAGDVVPIMFGTYGNSSPGSITMTGLAVTDIEIYKDGSIAQRASDAGYTLLDTDGIDFDGITGIHGFSIDTGDNTDAGFYTVGAWFTVVVSAITVDSQTVSFIAAMFRLMPAESIAGKPKVDVDAWLGTAAATPTVAGVPEVDVTHFNGTAGTFASGRPEVNTTHWKGTAAATVDTAGYPVVTIKDGTGAGEIALTSGAVDTVTTLTNAPSDSSGVTTLLSRVPSGIFTGITSLAQWLGLIAGKQTGNSTARTEVRATGAGSGTYDETTDSLEAVRDNTGTAGAGLTNIDLPNQTMDITGNITGNLSGSVGSVTGAVGSVTGNVGGNVTGSVGSLATQAKTDVNAEVASALATYDPPTRTEATADKDEILTQLPAAPVKNATFTYVVKMVASSDHVTPKTGLTVTMTRSIDGAAFGAATGTVTEISTGHYKVAASAADMNGDVVAHRFTGTDADDLTVVLKTVS